ncbi:hypothetical protein ACFOPN_22170 [Xanthomonas hyacinthi]|uniref:hypothetical protein n=1 Tax=Xanthomonas hyacinthi TaxID=56455 RepID=UPI00062D1358|nr:hypothetical protein [Xanthomonas hyacinthi]KLD78571.1 hypothetical protein Y886_09485 [Xanthomonas hyacinthi DSM 19077]
MAASSIGREDPATAPEIRWVYNTVELEEIRHTTAKERRICDTVEPVLNQHRLVVDKALIRADAEADNHHYQLFHQLLSRMTRDRGAVKHDDRVEPLAMALAYWAD